MNNTLTAFMNSQIGSSSKRITEFKVCMKFDASIESELPWLVYSVEGYIGKELEFELIVHAGGDGCMVSKRSLLRRTNLLNLTIGVAKYLAECISGSHNDIAISYLPTMVNDCDLLIPERCV